MSQETLFNKFPSIQSNCPPVDLVVLVLPILDGADIESGLVWEHQTPGGQPLDSTGLY